MNDDVGVRVALSEVIGDARPHHATADDDDSTRAHLINSPAFGRRYVPSCGVARQKNTPSISPPRVWQNGRLDALDAAPVLSLAIDADHDPVAAGEALTYTIHFGNRSNETVGSAELRVQLPTGLTFDGATAGGSLDGDEVSFAQLLDREAQRHVFSGGTEDAAEAGRAFIEKRTPSFKGR